MTTLVEAVSHREWRVNRLRTTLHDIALECGEPVLSRSAAQRLAAQLRVAAAEMADIFVCPVCGHPEACTCAECPVGALTAVPPVA
jgi:hypothetical protein